MTVRHGSADDQPGSIGVPGTNRRRPTVVDMSDAGEGLSQAAHDETPAQIVERYDGWAEHYEHDVRSWGYTLPEDIAELVAAASPVGSVLDAGCGTGLIGRALADRGIPSDRLIGVDVSATSLALAEAGGCYREAVQVDLTAGLPFDDDAFGAVVCGGVLTYVAEPESVLLDFVRVTCPGGVVVFSQRTDLWAERAVGEALARVRAHGHRVDIGEPVPYLPDLAEYGTEIEVVFTTIEV